MYSTTVVFLQGTSRSGKSSICNAIKQYEHWGAVGSVYFSYCLQVFDKLFPEDFACIKDGIEIDNIRHAITRNMFFFKKGLSKNKKTSIRLAAQKIQDYFSNPNIYARHKEEFSAFSLKEIRQRIEKGLHVLADVSWYVKQENIQKINSVSKILSVLVYCPFDIVIDRLLQRNKTSLETGNIMNYRFFVEPLKSFMSLYDLSPEKSDAIDKIEKTTFFACLDTIESALPHEAVAVNSSKFMMLELTREQLKKYRKTFLKKFEKNNTLYVVPKIKYNMLLETKARTPQECAKEIAVYATGQLNSIHKKRK